MSEKDNIEKIDEQIDSLLHSSDEEEETSVVEEEIGDTKKINSVKDIEEIEKDSKVEEDTKRISKVEDTKQEEVEDLQNEEKDDKEDNNSNKNDLEDCKKKKSKKKIIILVSVIVLVILLIALLFFLLRDKKEVVEVEKEDVLSKSEQKEILTEYGDALKGVLSVYYDKQKVLLEYDDAIKLVHSDYKVKCSEHEIYEDGMVYLNQCSIDGVKTKYSYGEKQEKKEEVIISEDAIKVYVSKSNQKATLKEPKNIDDYEVYAFEIDGAYSDLTLLNENSSPYVFYADSDYYYHMINFKTGKKVLDMLPYQSILPIQFGEEYDSNYVAVRMNEKWGVYNLNNNERVVSHQYDSMTPILYMGISGPPSSVRCLEDGIIAVENHTSDYSSITYGLIDYRNGTSVIPMEYNRMLESGKYLWAIDAFGYGHIFDHYGKEFLADDYDDIYWIVDGKYILVQDGENTKLVSIKGKEIYDYGKLEIGSIHYGLTYNNGAIFQFDNKDAVEGDYSTQCLEVIYDSSKKSGEVKTSECGGIAKPILYLYPKKTTNVTVSFEHPEYLQTTYPKFDNQWKVTAHKNGDLYDSNHQYYYGLYWDEKKVHFVDFSTGFYVEKENAISFLEEKLDKIGFNRKEANEFIMYWLPILEKNEKNLVYFELTEERESYQKIHISPKPDSLLRVVIHVKKVDKKTSIKEEKLSTFKRNGFVAVEWGGTTY